MPEISSARASRAPLHKNIFRLLKALTYGIVAALSFAWGHRPPELLWTWLFRSLTLLSFCYLIYDRIYETSATVSVSASDPRNPLDMFPFSINNNSHLFEIRDIRWGCQIITARNEYGEILRNMMLSQGTKSVIEKGGNLNISCLGKDNFRFIKFDGDQHIIDANI